ncbi:MAG: Rrf2 family transcriptional regulator, partial [Chloroflexi bacterium]|nr:Rrf2 family transcriptional regulator [Chloroflexota bacterium]
AQTERSGWLSAADIASGMRIPARFLPQVMASLARARLVISKPGPGGGYALARPPAEIDILSVIAAVEGDGRRITCVLRGAPCGVDGLCIAHPAFAGAQDAFLDRLAATNLATLASGPDEP